MKATAIGAGVGGGVRDLQATVSGVKFSKYEELNDWRGILNPGCSQGVECSGYRRIKTAAGSGW